MLLLFISNEGFCPYKGEYEPQAGYLQDAKQYRLEDIGEFQLEVDGVYSCEERRQRQDGGIHDVYQHE